VLWKSSRWHGLAGLLGGLLCVALTPIQTFIWSREASPAWVLAIRPLLDRYLAIYERVGASLGLSDYYFFGRMFFLVYLLVLLPLLAVHAGQSVRGVRLESVGFRWSLAGLITAAVGDVGAYWGGSDPDTFAAIQGVGFTLELLAILIILVSSVLYGVATLRAGVLPRWYGWLLITATPTAILTTAVVTYVPHGTMLPISLTWAVIGALLIVAGDRRLKNVGRATA
jgi:hypothetical protein